MDKAAYKLYEMRLNLIFEESQFEQLGQIASNFLWFSTAIQFG